MLLAKVGALLVCAGIGVWVKLTWPAHREGDESFQNKSGYAGWALVVSGLCLAMLDATT